MKRFMTDLSAFCEKHFESEEAEEPSSAPAVDLSKNQFSFGLASTTMAGYNF